MDRRKALKSLAAAGAATTLSAPAIAQTAPTIRWRMQSSYPRSLEVLFGGSELMAKAVAESTDNRFIIQVFAAGEIVPPQQVLDGVSNGTVEAGHSAAYFYIGKDPAFGFGTALPFGPNSRQHQAWLYYAGGLELMNEFYAKYRVLGLPGGNTGNQMGGWFRKELKSASDISGIKMRIPGIAGNILQKLGVVPQSIAVGDIYPALERGAIDAAELVGPHDDERFGFAKVAPYYYYPGFWEGSANVDYFFNLDRYNELPANYQSILRRSSAYANAQVQARYDALNPLALRRLVAAGAQLRAFPDDLIDKAYDASTVIYRDLAEKSPDFKKIFEHMKAFQQLSSPWWQISDLSYDFMNVRLDRRGAR